MDYKNNIIIAEACQWIPVSERIPEDHQFCIVLESRDLCYTETFYLSLYLDDNTVGCGPANQWGSDDAKVLYWLPIPSVWGVEGFNPSEYMVRRELDREALKNAS